MSAEASVLFNFVIGFICGLLFPFLFYQGGEKKERKSRLWESIETLEYTTDFEAVWKTKISAEGLSELIGLSFVEKSKSIKFNVNPGRYTVRVLVKATFTKRGDSESSTE